MNREIKLRAWYDKAGLWVYFHPARGFATPTAYTIYKEILLSGETWYQFTGLSDKNGKEIYEGDLVQPDDWNYPFEVIFNNERARFVCKLKTGITQYIDGEILVIIGNIFETPELLK